MKKISQLKRWFTPCQLVALLALIGSVAHAHDYYTSENIVSDVPGLAHETDPAAINPWGLVTGTAGAVHVSDNATGVATMYGEDGALENFSSGTNVITIPFASSTIGAPTGVADNQHALLIDSDSADFEISANGVSGPSHFIYCTEDGLICGFNPKVSGTSALVGSNDANQSSDGAGYTGVALSYSGTATKLANLNHELFAANFAAEKIDVFDSSFNLITPAAANPFVDPSLPSAPAGKSWSPFNIHTLDFVGRAQDGDKIKLQRLLLVAYALHDKTSAPLNEIHGAGNGFVDIYKVDGTFVQRLAPVGTDLNAPWGICVAHRPMPGFGAPIVVFIGSHGDGMINAYAIDPTFPDLDQPLGHLIKDKVGNPLAFQGLWALRFSTKDVTPAQFTTSLGADIFESTASWFFSAGIVNEDHGLIGKIIIPK